jgi:hypothetical protein
MIGDLGGPQTKKFKEAAREFECGDDDQRFEKRLKSIVRVKSGSKQKP